MLRFWNIIFFFTDEDGDEITFSSDLELEDAVRCMTRNPDNNLLRIYVRGKNTGVIIPNKFLISLFDISQQCCYIHK